MPRRALPNGIKLGFIEEGEESAEDGRRGAPVSTPVKPYWRPKQASKPPSRGVQTKKFKAVKPRKPRVLCQDVSSERVEGYVKALREYHRQLRIYEYQLNIVDKCDETQLREFLSRVVMCVVRCLVAADTVHGEYVEKATLRCDCDAMHAVDSFMITLYKKDDCIDKFSKDMILLEEILSDFSYSILAIKHGFNSRVANCVGEISAEAENRVKGLTWEDKDRMELRWKRWLHKTTFDDCQTGPFNRHELSKLVKPPYTVEYQLKSNNSGAFAHLNSDQVNPIALCYKKLSEMPEPDVSAGDFVIYEKGTVPTRTHKEMCDLIHKIAKSPRAQAAANKTDLNTMLRYVRR